MIVGLDATPLLGSLTGVGTYTLELLRGLAACAAAEDVHPWATAFSARARGLAAALPPGVAAHHRPVPARALRAAWARVDLPRVELLGGRADVFHATNFVLPPSRAAGVVTVHDLTYERFPETVHRASLAYRELVPRGLRRAAAVCTPSSAVAEEVVDTYRLDPALVHVTPLGVDGSWFDAAPPDPAARRRLGLPAEGPYLVALGTREPRKNLDVLLAAHRLLERSGATPPLVLVGAAGWGGQESPGPGVLVTGYLPGADARAVVAGAAALVFPSRYEGFGLPPLEALAAGTLPVVADLAVTREVLGDQAVRVPVGDVAALAAALTDVAAAAGDRDDAARARRREHARAWTWDACVSATLAAYRAAVA